MSVFLKGRGLFYIAVLSHNPAKAVVVLPRVGYDVSRLKAALEMKQRLQS